MYRTARAQKNGFEAAILACREYVRVNNKYPTPAQLIKWCRYQTPKIEGVQHRFANIIIPILKYPQYEFIEYTRDHLCQFIYDYVEKESIDNNNTLQTNHDVLKIQKCIMDFKIDGKTFINMDQNQWIQRLDDYFVSKQSAKKYYQIIVEL